MLFLDLNVKIEDDAVDYDQNDYSEIEPTDWKPHIIAKDRIKEENEHEDDPLQLQLDAQSSYQINEDEGNFN